MPQGSGTDAPDVGDISSPPASPSASVPVVGAVRTAARVTSLTDRMDVLRRGAASPRVQARAAFALTCVLVVGIAWLLADTVWFMATGGRQGDDAGRPAARTAAAAPPAVDLQRVAAQHLFGVATAAPPPAADGPAPVTSLPLQLLGVFVAGRPEDSTAVIAEQNRDGDLFRVGDTLPGNAVLAEVHDDNVVLQRGAERETLSFPAVGSGFASRDENTGDTLGGNEFQPEESGVIEVQPSEPQVIEQTGGDPAQTSATNGGNGSSLARYRDRLKSEPTNVLSEIGMQPISGGSAQGYRVGDNVAAGLGRVGLQPGDVVLTVNGRPVGNIQNDQQQVDSVMSQGSARLEIQRGNRRIFVTASLR